MEKKDLRIVYLGTPDFAVESLRRLVEGGYRVVGVVTTPDKPVGRHQNHLQPSPVKTYALEHGLPLLQPAKLKDETFVDALRQLKADLQIVVAFRMLPEVVWAMPRYGTFNLHASLLPQYRGAAPINWSIINGEHETGITTFFLQHDIDTGDIIDQIHVPLGPDDTFGEVHDRLMKLGGDLVCKTVDSLLDGTLKAHKQVVPEGIELHPAPKLFRETCRIDWSRSVEQLHNFVRGLSPVPAAWTTMSGDRGFETVKIFRTELSHEKLPLPPYHVFTDGRKELSVSLPDGKLRILELQVAGKKRMLTPDFLHGFKAPQTTELTVK